MNTNYKSINFGIGKISGFGVITIKDQDDDDGFGVNNVLLV